MNGAESATRSGFGITTPISIISEFEFDEAAGTLKPSTEPKIIAGIPLTE